MRTIVLIIFILLVVACRKEQVSLLPVVNLESIRDLKVELKLSNLADSIRYIALETSDSCLMEGNCSLMGITDDYIYVQSPDKIYQYECGGRFLRNIGRQGRGPMEYANISMAKMYGNQIYILTWAGEMVVYDEKGEFIKKNSSKKNKMSGFEVIDDSTLIAEEKEYGEEGGMRQYLTIYRGEQPLFRKLFQQDDNEFKRDIFLKGSLYALENEVFYKSLFSDTIYKIGSEQVVPSRVLTYGKYDPNREMCENYEKRKKAEKAGYIFNQMFFETSGYWFVWSQVDDKYYLTVYDKLKKESIYNKTPENYPLRENGGIYDDLTGIGTYFWPIYGFRDGKRLAGITNANNFSTETVEAFKKMNISIDENSNPVIAICYLKN